MQKKFVILLLSFFFFFSTFLFAYSYKISDVNFDITGMTKEFVIKRAIEIDTKTVFEDEESFLRYLKELEQTFENTRNFESTEITYSATEPEDDLCYVTLNIKTKDSFHFLALPYFKYSTSKGLSVKIKMKDTNFIGSMNTLSSSIDFNWKPDEEGNQFKIFEPEFNFSYDHPFKINNLDFTWTNNHSISYTWGEDSPDWSLETGLAWSYPMDKTSLNIAFVQGFFRDLDYRKYGDDTYLSENLNISTPLKLVEIDHYGPITFTPSINLNYKFDPFNPNGYSGFSYKKLMGPTITASTSFDFSSVNWNGNYRNGVSASFAPSATYNFASISNNVPAFEFGISTHIEAFKSYDSIGFIARFWGFGFVHNSDYISGSNTFDNYLRGIVDGRKNNINSNVNQTETPVAIVFNFDMPIHILTTDWENYKLTKNLKFMRYFNFELHASPFIDIALIQATNERQGYSRLFNLKDGFYTAGVELLVFPEKWKSNIVRISVGYDIGTLLYGPLLENSWRNKRDEGKNWIKTAELSIGLGLHY